MEPSLEDYAAAAFVAPQIAEAAVAVADKVDTDDLDLKEECPATRILHLFSTFLDEKKKFLLELCLFCHYAAFS